MILMYFEMIRETALQFIWPPLFVLSLLGIMYAFTMKQGWKRKVMFLLCFLCLIMVAIILYICTWQIGL